MDFSPPCGMQASFFLLFFFSSSKSFSGELVLLCSYAPNGEKLLRVVDDQQLRHRFFSKCAQQLNPLTKKVNLDHND